MTDTAVEQEIIGLSHEWMGAVAKRDCTALERILAADFLIAGWLPEGRLGDRKAYIEDCMIPIDIEEGSYSFDQWKIRVYDNTAIANCRMKIHAVVRGKEWGGAFLMTYVWIQQGRTWHVATCHTSAIVDAHVTPAG
ncbi:MAG: nuclear transport factor 2 family protein [Acidobacteriota bacterium]